VRLRADGAVDSCAWSEARQATWRSPADIEASYRNASFLGNNRVVFNIGGNKYRLVVALKCSAQLVFIRVVGTHAQYDEIDASEVQVMEIKPIHNGKQHRAAL